MGSNEPISSKQFLSKIEEGQAKLYYDFGKRVHSYFEETINEMQQYLQQLSPQNEGTIIDETGTYEQSLHNYELLQQEVEKLKRTNENQKSQIQKLKDDNAQLIRKATKTSTRKIKNKNQNENETDNLSSPDETEPKTRKTRTPKNMKTINTFTGEEGTNENESEPVDHKSIDRFQDEVDDKENTENLESHKP